MDDADGASLNSASLACMLREGMYPIAEFG